MKELIIDVVFMVYIAIILPIASFLYLAYAFTNLNSIFIIAGLTILWAVMIPYPVYKYINMKFLYNK
ncbi:MAG: hypothetical protein J7J36_01120 [Thermoplasmata archaeon]|nr:hypothetical protein [Thermoplasmata archaeon]